MNYRLIKLANMFEHKLIALAAYEPPVYPIGTIHPSMQNHRDLSPISQEQYNQMTEEKKKEFDRRRDSWGHVIEQSLGRAGGRHENNWGPDRLTGKHQIPPGKKPSKEDWKKQYEKLFTKVKNDHYPYIDKINDDLLITDKNGKPNPQTTIGKAITSCLRDQDKFAVNYVRYGINLIIIFKYARRKLTHKNCFEIAPTTTYQYNWRDRLVREEIEKIEKNQAPYLFLGFIDDFSDKEMLKLTQRAVALGKKTDEELIDTYNKNYNDKQQHVRALRWIEDFFINELKKNNINLNEDQKKWLMEAGHYNGNIGNKLRISKKLLETLNDIKIKLFSKKNILTNLGEKKKKISDIEDLIDRSKNKIKKLNSIQNFKDDEEMEKIIQEISDIENNIKKLEDNKSILRDDINRINANMYNSSLEYSRAYNKWLQSIISINREFENQGIIINFDRLDDIFQKFIEKLAFRANKNIIKLANSFTKKYDLF